MGEARHNTDPPRLTLTLPPTPKDSSRLPIGVVARQDRILGVEITRIAGHHQLAIGLLDESVPSSLAPKVGADRTVDTKRRIKAAIRKKRASSTSIRAPGKRPT